MMRTTFGCWALFPEGFTPFRTRSVIHVVAGIPVGWGDLPSRGTAHPAPRGSAMGYTPV
ncbi:hypothetical protein [uncultured Porphyromonas sp.]|uniref:hypothetical protein n=1 Tax=uncultured Porphyromonas sp. TaxID=159274 RepID=UPI00260188BB|nr:hypothetical protein [uncultured Porphyromonas sp.]